MKIKCPYCAEEYDKSGLENHFDNYPHHATESYIELIFKIHEKIEFYKNWSETNPNSIYAQELLKSLLENEN